MHGLVGMYECTYHTLSCLPKIQYYIPYSLFIEAASLLGGGAGMGRGGGRGETRQTRNQQKGICKQLVPLLSLFGYTTYRTVTAHSRE